MMRVGLALLGFALLAGCAREPQALPPPVPMDAPDVEAALEAIRSQAVGVWRYQGIVRVRGRGPDGGFDGRLVVIFERPEALRVELMGMFAGTRWSAVAASDRIRAYFPSRRQYLDESDVAEVVGRLLGVRLTTDEVMAVLSGVGVPIDSTTNAHGERRGPITIITPETAGRRIELDRDGQVVRADGGSYRVSYPTSWKSRGRQIPDELVLSNEEVRAVITPEDVDVNVALDPGAFALDVPADAARLRPADVEGEAVFVVARDPGDP